LECAITSSFSLGWRVNRETNILTVGIDRKTHTAILVKERIMKIRNQATVFQNQMSLLKSALDAAQPHCPNLLTFRSFYKDSLYFRSSFSPFGTPMDPKSHCKFSQMKILVDALIQVISGVRHFHNKLEFVHNDIRWPNVVMLFILVDYDYAHKLSEKGTVPAVEGLAEDSHWNSQMKREHSKEVDIWGIGYLMQTALSDLHDIDSISSEGTRICTELEANPKTSSINLESIQSFLSTLLSKN